MKFFLVTLTVLFSLFSATSNASDVKVSPVILESFNSSFENATEVKWSVSKEYYKADFSFNGQIIAAFFDVDGKVVATTKNISPLQLPISLQKNLKKEDQDLWITELFEVSDDNGTSYYATLENADTKLVLKSAGSDWSTYQKLRKS